LINGIEKHPIPKLQKKELTLTSTRLQSLAKKGSLSPFKLSKNC